MTDLKLSTVWKIEDFAAKFERMQNEKCAIQSDELPELRHVSLPGLQWLARLKAAPGHRKSSAGFYLLAKLGSSDADPKSIWANYRVTVVDADLREVASFGCRVREYSFPVNETFRGYGVNGLQLEEMNTAVQNDGSLCVRIDLTIVSVPELLKCRDRMRGFLKNEAAADFEVKVADRTFKLHKVVLLESGMKEAAEGSVLELTHTNPAAFNAFAQAMYFDNWDFLGDTDLTQDVLFLAEKFNVHSLKNHCDDSLAEKINEANALEILTKSAALCNAEKTKAACIEILAEQSEFEESQVWIDFMERSEATAFRVLDAIRVKIIRILKQKLDAANEELKRESEDSN